MKQIGQLSYENAWLKKDLANSRSRKDRMNIVDKGDEKLSIVRQAELLGINRTSLYYRAIPITDAEYNIKRIIDEVYAAHPEYG